MSKKKNNTSGNRQSSRKENVFIPVMDWWLAILIVILLGALVIGLITVVWQPMVWKLKIIATLSISFCILYVLDLAFFMSYRLEKNGLVISNQLRQITIPYREMRELRPGNFWYLFSYAGKKRFSLSANNLLIKTSSEIWQTVSISPKHRQEFINMLLHRIEEERSSRASLLKKKNAA